MFIYYHRLNDQYWQKIDQVKLRTSCTLKHGLLYYISCLNKNVTLIKPTLGDRDILCPPGVLLYYLMFIYYHRLNDISRRQDCLHDLMLYVTKLTESSKFNPLLQLFSFGYLTVKKDWSSVFDNNVIIFAVFNLIFWKIFKNPYSLLVLLSISLMEIWELILTGMFLYLNSEITQKLFKNVFKSNKENYFQTKQMLSHCIIDTKTSAIILCWGIK
jgi:hypothetical protein